MTSAIRLLTVLATLVASIWVASALSQVVERKPTASRPIALSAVRASDRSTPTPNFAPLASGLYGKQIVQTASTRGDYTVQIWALLVSPNTTTGEAKLPGAPVLTVQSGSVELLVGDSKTRLDPGAVATLPEGAPLRLINLDQSRPAHLRAVVLVGNR